MFLVFQNFIYVYLFPVLFLNLDLNLKRQKQTFWVNVNTPRNNGCNLNFTAWCMAGKVQRVQDNSVQMNGYSVAFNTIIKYL